MDLEPLAEAIVARLRPMLEAGEAKALRKRAFRTPEVAEVLSISDSEVRLLIAAGELDSIRVGRVRLVPSAAIDAYIERKLGESRGGD